MIIKHYKTIYSLIFLTVILATLIAPSSLLAQSTVNTGAGGQSGPIIIVNPFKEDTIQGLIETIVNDILIPIGGVVAVMMIMYAGFLFVTARGNPAQIAKAKDALIYAVIGAAILLGAWVISTAIQGTIDDLRA